MPIELAFEKAYQVMLRYEISPTKVWDNHPNDPGGFTYYGIARNKHPHWPGWAIVDADMARFGRPRKVDECVELDHLVRQFYFREFWLKNNIDKIAELSPACAVEVFEATVNGGGVFILQKTLNTMNKNQALWPDLQVDGAIGPVTLSALRSALKARGEAKVYKRLNLYQAKRYFELQEDNPARFEAFDGWFDRITVTLPEG